MKRNLLEDGYQKRVYSNRMCVECMSVFLASRNDAIACGPKCRKRLSRKCRKSGLRATDPLSQKEEKPGSVERKSK